MSRVKNLFPIAGVMAFVLATELLPQTHSPKPDREEILPVALLPDDPEELKRRLTRSRRFDTGHGIVRLDEISPAGGGVSSSVNVLAMPELPFDQVDTVIVGKVSSAQPFLSADRSALYTEYEVQVRCVLKASAKPLSAGELLTVVRVGGVARMPKGHVVRHPVQGYEPIVKGGRYLMFLTYLSDDDSFGTTKLWQLDGEILKALSGADQVKADRGTSNVHLRRLDEVFPEEVRGAMGRCR